MAETNATPGVFVSEMDKGFEIRVVTIVEDTEFAVEIVARLSGPVAHQIMDAAVNEIIFVLPGRGHAARLAVVFEDVRLVAIHLTIAAHGQPRQSCADDDDGFFSHDPEVS